MSIRTRVSAFFAKLRSDAKKRVLEGQLADIFKKMEGFKAQDVPAGNILYIQLKLRATEFVQASGFTWEEVSADVPMLYELTQLTDSSNAGSNKMARQVGQVGIVVIIAGTALTIYFAVLHNMYVVCTFWVNNHIAIR